MSQVRVITPDSWNFLPVNVCFGVPTSISPYHRVTPWLESGMALLSRLFVEDIIFPLNGCAAPVFASNAANV